MNGMYKTTIPIDLNKRKKNKKQTQNQSKQFHSPKENETSCKAILNIAQIFFKN